MTHLESLGFQVIGTGGGCTAWAIDHNGLEILVSDDASANLDGEYCSINAFDQNGFDVFYAECAVADLPQRLNEIFNLRG